ncbi:MAG TPA: putative 2OG-Fe(II) oxygenase [Pseudolabrys sp.]
MPETFDAAIRLSLLQQAVMNQPCSAKLLYKLAAEYAERGDDDAYANAFRRAYRIRPSLSLLRQIGTPPNRSSAEVVRRRATALALRGVSYAPVLAALAVAEAVLGNSEAARSLVDYERFFRCQALSDALADSGFNARLAEETRTKLKYLDVVTSNAIRKGWRHDDVLDLPLPATRALKAMLQTLIEDYMAALGADNGHPFVAARPHAFKIGSWAVVSNGDSHLVPHIHAHAWLTGVYYVVRPPVSRTRGSTRGWLRVGAPAAYGIGPERGWDERFVAPEPGTVALMPGYFFHNTRPIEVDEERICIAFDVEPAELAASAFVHDDT